MAELMLRTAKGLKSALMIYGNNLYSASGRRFKILEKIR